MTIYSMLWEIFLHSGAFRLKNTRLGGDKEHIRFMDKAENTCELTECLSIFFLKT